MWGEGGAISPFSNEKSFMEEKVETLRLREEEKWSFCG